MSKYHAIPTEVDNVRFASRAEARRYAELKILLAAGEITNLELHPRYPLIVNNVKVGTYVSDFSYTDARTGAEITEDTKSPATKTPVYRLKKKLVKALYGVEILEVMS